MWNSINQILANIDNFVWGVPLMVIILFGGILLTVRLGLLQIRKLPLALKWMVKNEEEAEGEITSFAALCTALSATIGTGNIVGVATAVCAGGPGALFWMVITAFFGMATKYSEGLLAVKYRVIGEDGHSLGGPFYYIEQGMGKSWKWLAKLFAFFGVCVGLFGIGTFSQVNGISSAVNGFFDANNEHCVNIPFLGEYSWSVVIASLILAVCVALVLIGGVKRIASVSQVVVPFMAIIYVLFVAVLVIANITRVPAAFKVIVQAAFSPRAITGGAVGSMLVAMQKGVARGIFSNEAGLGSAPIAAAAAQTNEPVRQGLVSMTGIGRGGEEMLYLKSNGIETEEIPGVTSAIAVPAMAGIPVTHRDVSRSFSVVTGHTKDMDSLYEEIRNSASMNGTCVYLMGLTHLAQITEALVSGGKPKNTPAAVITGGFDDTYRIVKGTLADIELKVREAGITSPAVIVTGEAVNIDLK